jgi:hypothetical protein
MIRPVTGKIDMCRPALERVLEAVRRPLRSMAAELSAGDEL